MLFLIIPFVAPPRETISRKNLCLSQSRQERQERQQLHSGLEGYCFLRVLRVLSECNERARDKRRASRNGATESRT
jgi:hypothetical protein